MATIGLAYFMEGFGDLMWGADVKTLNVGIPQGGSLWFEDFTIGWAAEGEKFYGMYVDLLDVWAAIIAVSLVLFLTIGFFFLGFSTICFSFCSHPPYVRKGSHWFCHWYCQSFGIFYI